MAGQIIRRGDRKWLVRIYLGTGKRRYHNHTVRGSKKDAERYRTAALRSRDLAPAKLTTRSEPPKRATLSSFGCGPIQGPTGNRRRTGDC